jgi:hypothetical protein
VDEGAAVLVAEGEVGGGEGGERGGVARLRGSEELLLRWAPLPATAGVDVHCRHQGVGRWSGTGRRAVGDRGGAGGRRSSEGKTERSEGASSCVSGAWWSALSTRVSAPSSKKEDELGLLGFLQSCIAGPSMWSLDGRLELGHPTAQERRRIVPCL